MNAIKLKGVGEVMDGKFGAAMRADFDQGGATKGEGYAYWKPIDQFKLIIGQSHTDDGFWGKEGNSGWSFNQKAYDGIATGSNNIWGGPTERYVPTLKYRNAFADDLVANGVFMEIKPMDMLGINIGLPVFDGGGWNKAFFRKVFFQVDLNFSFGNIAVTYKDSSVFMYFGGSFGAIGLDVGLSVPDLIVATGSTFSFSKLYFGAALKYSGGAFGVKFRTAVGIPANSLQTFDVLFDVLPFFAINDNMCVFVNTGMGMAIKNGLVKLGWQFNPYLRIGAEWGPSFYVGIQVEQKSKGGSVDFALPIGITVGF